MSTDGKIEVIEAFRLVDTHDGPAEYISPRRAAWLVDGAVVIASAYSRFAASSSDRQARRSPDARPRP